MSRPLTLKDHRSERFLGVDLLEVAAGMAASNVRWEVRGRDMVLRGDLLEGHIELIPRGARRFELRVLDQDLAGLAGLMAALGKAEAVRRSHTVTHVPAPVTPARDEPLAGPAGSETSALAPVAPGSH